MHWQWYKQYHIWYNYSVRVLIMVPHHQWLVLMELMWNADIQCFMSIIHTRLICHWPYWTKSLFFVSVPRMEKMHPHKLWADWSETPIRQAFCGHFAEHTCGKVMMTHMHIHINVNVDDKQLLEINGKWKLTYWDLQKIADILQIIFKMYWVMFVVEKKFLFILSLIFFYWSWFVS